MLIRRALLVVISAMLPVALLVDVVFGDFVTGVKKTAKEKYQEHKTLYAYWWNGSC